MGEWTRRVMVASAVGSGSAGRPSMDSDDGLDEQLAGDDGGHGIAGDADDGLAFDDAQHDGMTGSDGDAVNYQAAQRLDRGGGVVLASRRMIRR